MYLINFNLKNKKKKDQCGCANEFVGLFDLFSEI